MDNSQLQSSEAKLLLRPHRRSPLKSQTYETLARIFSLCGDQNQTRRLVKFAPNQQNPESLFLDENIFSGMVQNTENRAGLPRDLGRTDSKVRESQSETREKEVAENSAEKVVCNESDFRRLDITELESLTSVSEKAVDESNTAKGVHSNCQLRRPDIMQSKSLSSARAEVVDNSNFKKEVCSSGDLSRSDMTELQNLSSVRLKVVGEGDTENGVSDHGVLGISDITDSESLSSARPKFVYESNTEEGVCKPSELDSDITEMKNFSSIKEKVVDELNAETVVLEHGELSRSDGTELVSSSDREKVVDESNSENGVCNRCELGGSNISEPESLSSVRKKDICDSNSKKEVCSHTNLGVSDVTDLEDMLSARQEVDAESIQGVGLQKNVSNVAQRALDEIENILSAEDDGVFLKQRENMADEDNERTDFQKNYHNWEGMMIDELEALVNDVVALASDSVNNSITYAVSMDQTNNYNAIVAPKNIPEHHFDFSESIAEPKSTFQVGIGGENLSKKESESLGLRQDNAVASHSIERRQSKSSSGTIDTQNAEIVGQHKDSEDEPIPGEIEGEVSDIKVDVSSQHLQTSGLENKRLEKEQLSESTVEEQHGSSIDTGLLKSSSEMIGTENLVIAAQNNDSGNGSIQEEIEEGEVFDVIEADGANQHLESSGLQNEKLDEGQLSEHYTVTGKLGSSGHNESNARDLEYWSPAQGFGANTDSKSSVEVRGSNIDAKSSEHETISREKSISSDSGEANRSDYSLENEGSGIQSIADKVVGKSPQIRSNSLVFYGDIMEENAATEQELISGKDNDVSKKRKRGPLSEEKKEKKKQKKRKKRAEKNRELGVKRLKLPPVVMRKTVKICHHYLEGKCWEGERCKFSHDAVPLTKSKPCCYFAKSSCMKGDDCPFDHQLSKYPCTNYASKGFCSRGDKCMFSHKVVIKGDSEVAADAGEQGQKTLSAVEDLKSKKQPEMSSASRKAADNVLKSLGISFKGMSQVTKIPQLQVNKPETSSSNSTVYLSPVKADFGGLSSSKNNEGRFVKRPAEISLPSTGKMNDIVKTQPPVAPKGINFLSFGRKSTINTSCSMSGNLSSSVNEKNKVTQPSSTSMNKNVRPNEVLITAHSLAESEGVKDVLCGTAQCAKANTSKKSSSPSLGNSMDNTRCAQGEQSGSKPQTPSLKSLMLSFSASSQSLDCSTPQPHKKITNSAQKALSSTLAFAARCEKEIMKKKFSDVDHATSSADTKGKSGEGARDNNIRALKILDFLASMGKKK